MAIYGECIGGLTRVPVTISALGGDGCDFQPEASDCLIDGPLDLWIGAVGPFTVTTEKNAGGRYRARFREPLDQRIIAHFTQG
ncbi:hypothetical protein [Novosphingobium sp. M1R2S20]|uniref:Uncharacterized protein n=1 Tax=Novosphingobium rhizovicinum TaxID=3228928 RepID=A0ABV3R8P5_9SPHN